MDGGIREALAVGALFDYVVSVPSVRDRARSWSAAVVLLAAGAVAHVVRRCLLQSLRPLCNVADDGLCLGIPAARGKTPGGLCEPAWRQNCVQLA